MDEKAMRRLSCGLFVLTAEEDGKDNGCIINTALQVSSAPNRISICVSKENLTHDMIRRTGGFTVSVLSEGAHFGIFERFGFHSGRDVDKFKDYSECIRGKNGILCITEGTNAYISAKVEMTEDVGSHTMFIGSVTDMEVLNDEPSATYEYYKNNIKPAPKPAEEASGKTVWRCIICGYEYEGEELPSDFICPLCKHPASDFEKVIK